MANGYFERGEVYWVSISDMGGAEMGVTRPGLIVSSDEVNRTGQATVVYLTSQCKDSWEWCVPTEATGRKSWIKCDAPVTINSSRFRNFLGAVNAADMRLVEDALEKVFDLGYADDTALKEKDEEIAARNAVIAEKDREIETLKAQIAAAEKKAESDTLSYRIESEMFHKLYEKTLTQLVDMKFTNDLFLKRQVPVIKMAEPNPEEPKLPEPPKEPEQPDDRVDINHCTITALKKLGFSLPMANKITECRPFKDVPDLKRVPGLKAIQYRIMEPKLCCTPIAEEPKREIVEPDNGCEELLNINAATAEEIHEATGVNISSCHSIVGYRKKNGPYQKLEDLLALRDFYPATLKKFDGKVAFGEAPAAPVPPCLAQGEKVNVNTTNAKQITLLTGLNQKTAQAVVRYRKENGPFASLDELLNVPEFGVNCMRKYQDALEV